MRTPWKSLQVSCIHLIMILLKTSSFDLFFTINGREIQVNKEGQTVPLCYKRKLDEKDRYPWNDASEYFQRVFSPTDPKTIKMSSNLLLFLGKEESISQHFLKSLESYLDIRVGTIRKRLENDLSRPLFSYSLTSKEYYLLLQLKMKLMRIDL